MFKVGDFVKIKNLRQFRFAGANYCGVRGKVDNVDDSDNSVRVDLGSGLGEVWFLISEVEAEMPSFESVGKAVECLISQGFKVTIEKV